ncbi:MAG: pyridoxal phosphate enzyme (YggS family) [Planctomycetota bacterium]
MPNAPTPSEEPALRANSETSPEELVSVLQRNLTRVQDRIAAAVAEVAAGAADGRPVVAPEIVAVTKTVPPTVAMALANLMAGPKDGLKDGPSSLAENRSDHFAEAVEAFKSAGQAASWHFIGHIQRNKARRILERSHVVHSIDSLRLAGTVARLADELERDIDVFVEVNLTEETEKYGLLAAGVPDVLEALGTSSRVRIRGLMAMGPARGLREVDDVFRDVAALARQLESTHVDSFSDGHCLLSMGMSGDLEAAIRHGSSFVRIGSALFEDVPRALPPTTPPTPQGPPS